MSAIPDVRVTRCPDPVCAVRLVGTMADLIEAVNVHLKADPHGAITPADWKTEPATGQDLTNWLAWQQIEAQRRAVDVAERLADLPAAESGHEVEQ